MKPFLFLLAISVALSPTHGLVQDRDDEKAAMIEPRTKIAFPIKRTIPAHQVRQDAKPVEVELAGIGVRDKYFVNVKVYAFGWYVEPRKARTILSPWIGKTAKAMSGDPNFSKAACSGGFVNSLRLVFYRDVEGEDVAEAFDASLEPRLEIAAKKMKVKDAKQDLAAFRAIFDADEIEEGDEIVFDFGPKGRIHTYLRGKQVSRMVSPALSWALQDVYLGMDSIEGNKEKAKVLSRLPLGVLKPKSDKDRWAGI